MATNLRRKAYDRLLKWKAESAGSSAILINGARRVGKTHLAEEFGRNEYSDYVVIDFNKPDPLVRKVFDDYNGNIDDFHLALSVAIGRRMPEGESLIVFDEVQLCPRARQMIKYLVEDGRYDYIETGSLLSIKANIEGIVIPSEEEDLNLYPLDFEEFLWAMGNETAVPYMRRCLEEARPVGEEHHRAFMNLFRKYMLVGGMPQAVVEFVETNSFERVEAVKRRILRTYRKDIARFAEGYGQRVIEIFDTIPSELNRKERRFRITSIGKNARSRNYEDAFMWLVDSMMVNRCVNSTDPRVGLSMSLDLTTQKIYMGDTGLLVTQCLDDEDMTSEDIYKSLLLGRLGINEGMFAENVVAQCLRANGRGLYFYSRGRRGPGDADGPEEGWDSPIEIDFLIRRDRRICPLEVKSSDRINHSSLDRFMGRFGSTLGQAYVLCTKDVRVDRGIVYLPIYMVSVLRRGRRDAAPGCGCSAETNGHVTARSTPGGWGRCPLARLPICPLCMPFEAAPDPRVSRRRRHPGRR